ncbi:glycosyltransferase family 4 protein [Caminicella sporogenes]|uniref:glycosyltransferase family 4 protein n=1 Tax=Caminicella sporogenes TaxID=166485 RepID=UPI0025401D3F|nr:glycosyltransferase family 4 protein [Caminicella sporogenes]WIF96090.1 glycosyltransferase family 4 protein [Caminicella sporogenes]
MRQLVISLPHSYKKYNLVNKHINFVFNETQNADVIIYNQDQIKNICVDKYVVLNVKDLNEFNMDNSCRVNIDVFLVYNIGDYENLSMEFGIDKKRIFLIDNNKIVESYNKLFNKIFNLLKDKLYDIQVSLSPDKWLSTNKSLKIYTNNNKLVFEDNESEKPYYVSYEKLGSFADHKIYNFEIESDKAYKIEFDCDFEESISCELFIIEFSENEKIDTHTVGIKNTKYFIPNDKTTKIRIAIRINGKGKITINKISFAELDVSETIKDPFINKKRNKILILTNIYPSDESLYRNAFVHRRVKEYVKVGLDVDVFVMKKDKYLSSYVFDDIRVLTGNKESLLAVLQYNNYEKILIHFVNKDMIEAINNFSDTIPKIVWIHGVEALSWKRRKCNYLNIDKETEKELNNKDNIKHSLLRSIIEEKTYKFVFVSNWLKKAVEEDIGMTITNYEIIPNIIDSTIFQYRKKTSEHRKRILSIRPYTAKNYANDLTVKAILELSKKDIFKELEFNLYGKGPLFKETVEPLRQFKNVSLNETFLTHKQISHLHKKHGIFLCPTRADTQGVSIGEAMSSGLVPITNKVQAIPEFVDDKVGILAPSDDYLALAKGIEEMYYNQDLFSELSQNAAKRVREQCGIDKTIMKEIEIIKK